MENHIEVAMIIIFMCGYNGNILYSMQGNIYQYTRMHVSIHKKTILL